MRLLIKHALSHSNIRFATPLWKSGRKTWSENTLASKCLDKMSSAKLSLSLYKANLSLLRHSSSCILCGISNSFIQIHIANSCTCFSCASLLRTMRYNAAGAQLHCAPDRTLGYAILFSLPFSPKHIGALRVHELRSFFSGDFAKLWLLIEFTVFRTYFDENVLRISSNFEQFRIKPYI